MQVQTLLLCRGKMTETKRTPTQLMYFYESFFPPMSAQLYNVLNMIWRRK